MPDGRKVAGGQGIFTIAAGGLAKDAGGAGDEDGKGGVICHSGRGAGSHGVHYDERPANQPTALRQWFYPGDNTGQEFVYHYRYVPVPHEQDQGSGR